MIHLVRVLLLLIIIIAALYVVIINILHRDITQPVTRNTFIHLIPTLCIGIITLLASWYFSTGSALRAILPIKSNMVKNFIAYTMWPTINASIILLATVALHITLIDKLIYAWKPSRRIARIPYPIALLITTIISLAAAANIYVVLNAESAHTIELERDYIVFIGLWTHLLLATITIFLLLMITIKYFRKVTQ